MNFYRREAQGTFEIVNRHAICEEEIHAERGTPEKGAKKQMLRQHSTGDHLSRHITVYKQS